MKSSLFYWLILIRYSILFTLISQSYSVLKLSYFDWKVYGFLVFIWFLIEMKILNLGRESNLYFTTLAIVGVLKMVLALVDNNFSDEIFFSPPDSGIYRALADGLYRCFEYSRNLNLFCEGDPYFQRGPSFSILLSLLTLGGNITVIPFVFIQVILCALTFKLIIDEIQKNNISFGVASVFILCSINPLIHSFSRLVLMETIGSFLIVLSFTLSRKGKHVKGSLFIWIILLILSLFMNLQFFVGVFLFFLKNIYQKNENFKNVLITLVVLIFFVFAWGERNKNYVGYWDFNPTTGCYLEKNLIESTEAFKLGTTKTEIRDSGHTYKLLEDGTNKHQTSSPEVCKKFLDIIPNYYFENTSYIFSTYKVFINNFVSPTQACQYKSIICESGYWFWIIGTISNYIFGISLLVLFIKKKTYIYDISVYVAILLVIIALAPIDPPRMRVVFEPIYFLVIGVGLSQIFNFLKNLLIKIKVK
tara:strand:+ start:1657 stop:3081 length:1425 start_codon:yes stop_codon:yes gene_type:complete